mmetsp:Transcript_56017/g.120579  ORF Transcript_56017/g.120579 Transcript_56017/m.120579 type:complete len:270 (+) Transcript_56017:388-1197(+)
MPLSFISVILLTLLRIDHVVESSCVHSAVDTARSATNRFHDVDLATVRPPTISVVCGQHPDGGPSPFYHWHLRAHFHTMARTPISNVLGGEPGRCVVKSVVPLALCDDLQGAIFDVGVLCAVCVVLQLLVIGIVTVKVHPLRAVHGTVTPNIIEFVRPDQGLVLRVLVLRVVHALAAHVVRLGPRFVAIARYWRAVTSTLATTTTDVTRRWRRGEAARRRRRGEASVMITSTTLIVALALRLVAVVALGRAVRITCTGTAARGILTRCD